MTYTYDLSSSDADELMWSKMRLLIPDNDSTAYYLEDAELDYFLDQTGDHIVAAAAKACKQLARQFSLKVDFEADGLRMENTRRAEAFAKRAAELEAEIAGSFSSVTLSRSDGFSDAATDTDYQSRTVYIKV